MGVFTAVGATELAELAAVFELGAVQHFEPIAAGTINTNFALDTDGGRYFVRLNEGKAEADVAWEARLVTALAAAGVVTPPPLVASYLSEMNEGVLRNLENQWHKIYIGWHAILGQLKARQRDDDGKSGFGAMFGKKEK